MTTDADEKLLDATFARMREDGLTASDDLLDRIMLDADAVLADTRVAPRPPRRRFTAIWRDVIGGWPTVSGLAAATVAGLWIGVAQPAALTDLSSGMWGGTIEVPLLESDIFAALEG